MGRFATPSIYLFGLRFGPQYPSGSSTWTIDIRCDTLRDYPGYLAPPSRHCTAIRSRSVSACQVEAVFGSPFLFAPSSSRTLSQVVFGPQTEPKNHSLIRQPVRGCTQPRSRNIILQYFEVIEVVQCVAFAFTPLSWDYGLTPWQIKALRPLLRLTKEEGGTRTELPTTTTTHHKSLDAPHRTLNPG